jgi:sec-independent protein translocase protein TatB
MADSIILMILALVVFGPRRLPQIGRQIGKLMFEFRKASNDFKFQMEEELRAAEEADRRKKEEAERQRVTALAAESQASVSAPAQTVESTADIGAVEPSAASSYPEQYEQDAQPAAWEAAEATPVIQAPQTGEQVSASARPSYHFDASASTAADEAAMNDVNPDADVTANAEEFAANGSGAVARQPAEEPSSPGIETLNHPSDEHASDYPSDRDLSPGTPSKEPIGQHG